MPENASVSKEINPWLIAIAVMSSTFMEVLDTTVVNVSLPHIAGNLSASTDEATWTLTSYLVANAIVLPMTGWLASTFGRKRLLAIGNRLHHSIFFLRTGAVAAVSDFVPDHSRRMWRRLAASVAGYFVGIVSCRKTRPGHGVLGSRHRGRSHAWAGGWRLAYGQLQLALGFLHQCSDRSASDVPDPGLHL
jgi:MFS family permease